MKNKTFSNFPDGEERKYQSDLYKDEGYRIFNSETQPEEQARGLRMVIEVYFDQLLAGGKIDIPTFMEYAAHFVNAQRGRYEDAVLDILESEFGSIEGKACIMPGYSSWIPGFQDNVMYRRTILPNLGEARKQKIKGL